MSYELPHKLCKVCDNNWTLKRDPCPGCGMLCDNTVKSNNKSPYRIPANTTLDEQTNIQVIADLFSRKNGKICKAPYPECNPIKLAPEHFCESFSENLLHFSFKEWLYFPECTQSYSCNYSVDGVMLSIIDSTVLDYQIGTFIGNFTSTINVCGYVTPCCQIELSITNFDSIEPIYKTFISWVRGQNLR